MSGAQVIGEDENGMPDALRCRHIGSRSDVVPRRQLHDAGIPMAIGTNKGKHGFAFALARFPYHWRAEERGQCRRTLHPTKTIGVGLRDRCFSASYHLWLWSNRQLHYNSDQR